MPKGMNRLGYRGEDMKKITAFLLIVLLVMMMLPTTAFLANGIEQVDISKSAFEAMFDASEMVYQDLSAAGTGHTARTTYAAQGSKFSFSGNGMAATITESDDFSFGGNHLFQNANSLVVNNAENRMLISMGTDTSVYSLCMGAVVMDSYGNYQSGQTVTIVVNGTETFTHTTGATINDNDFVITSIAPITSVSLFVGGVGYAGLTYITLAAETLIGDGWLEVHGEWYYYVDGVAQKGWISEKDAVYPEVDKWYYLDETTGAMQKGWKEIKGEWYYLNPADGGMLTGWLIDTEGFPGIWFYTDPINGDMQTGWQKIEDKYHYFASETGFMQTGWITGTLGYPDDWFYLDENGVMLTGWQTGLSDWEDSYFYFDETTGIMQTGWQTDAAGKQVYLDPETGAMLVSGTYEIEGKYYHLDAQGHVVDTHSFGKWQEKDATSHSRTCACGEEETEAHVWDAGIITKPATATEEGIRTYTCTTCLATKTETFKAEEQPTPSPSPSPTPTEPEEAPSTGDSNDIFVYALCLMVMLGIGIAVFLQRRRMSQIDG